MIRISGASDDIVCISGIAFNEPDEDGGSGHRLGRADASSGDDELGGYDAAWRFTIGSPEAKAGADAHGCIIVISYGDDRVSDAGVWVATVAPIDEDVACPWPVRVRFEGYSAIVEIDCPNGTPVVAAKVKS